MDDNNNLDPDEKDFVRWVREGREEQDAKMDLVIEEFKPNQTTLDAMREARDEVFVSSVDGSEMTLAEILEEMSEDNDEILKMLGSDYDDNGVPYWAKEDDGGMEQRGYNIEQIQGRDEV